MYRTILAGFDGSEGAKIALREAAEFGKLFGAKVDPRCGCSTPYRIIRKPLAKLRRRSTQRVRFSAQLHATWQPLKRK